MAFVACTLVEVGVACVVVLLDGPSEPLPANPHPTGATRKEGAADVEPPLPEGAVVVYGTSWCPACDRAKSYLASRRIPYVEKDIDREPRAARALDDKLKRAGMRTTSIPVIDVGGELIVGFDEDHPRRALAARKSRPQLRRRIVPSESPSIRGQGSRAVLPTI